MKSGRWWASARINPAAGGTKGKNRDGSWKEPWYKRSERYKQKQYNWQEDFSRYADWKKQQSGSKPSASGTQEKQKANRDPAAGNPSKPAPSSHGQSIYLDREWDPKNLNPKNPFALMGLTVDDAGDPGKYASRKRKALAGIQANLCEDKAVDRDVLIPLLTRACDLLSDKYTAREM